MLVYLIGDEPGMEKRDMEKLKVSFSSQIFLLALMW